MKRINIELWVMFISGFLFMVAMAGAHYLSSTDFSLIGIILVFLFGAALGLLGISPHTSFMKNLAFASAFLILFITAFTPIESAGNTWIVNKAPFWTILGLGIMFLDRELWNSVARARGQASHGYMTLVGSIVFAIGLQLIGVVEVLSKYMLKALWVVPVALILWWFYLWRMKLSPALRRDTSGLFKFFTRR